MAHLPQASQHASKHIDEAAAAHRAGTGSAGRATQQTAQTVAQVAGDAPAAAPPPRTAATFSRAASKAKRPRAVV